MVDSLRFHIQAIQPITDKRLHHTLMMEHVLTSKHRAFGKTMHFLTFGFLIPSHIPITLSLCPHSTKDTSKKRKGHMNSGSEKWNMAVFHLLSSQHLVVWAPLLKKHNRCRLSFSLLCSSIMCTRGSDSSVKKGLFRNFQQTIPPTPECQKLPLTEPSMIAGWLQTN